MHAGTPMLRTGLSVLGIPRICGIGAALRRKSGFAQDSYMQANKAENCRCAVLARA